MAHDVGQWKLSSGSRYTESQTILYETLLVFDWRNDVVCYVYSLRLLYKTDLNNYTAEISWIPAHSNRKRILVKTERQGICYLCEELSDAWQWDLAYESWAWIEDESHWNEYGYAGLSWMKGRKVKNSENSSQLRMPFLSPNQQLPEHGRESQSTEGKTNIRKRNCLRCFLSRNGPRSCEETYYVKHSLALHLLSIHPWAAHTSVWCVELNSWLT